MSETMTDVPQTKCDCQRYAGIPAVFMAGDKGRYPEPAPFLMSLEEVVWFFRLHRSGTKFPDKTIQRYRRMGLKTVRIGRRVWFRLDDILRFLDAQQEHAWQRRAEGG